MRKNPLPVSIDSILNRLLHANRNFIVFAQPTIPILLTIAFFCNVSGQNKIDWDGQYELQLNDFQSGSTQIGQGTIYSLQTATGFDFQYNMSSFEFMVTKNFNSRVNCSFTRNASSLIAPDSSIAFDLLRFARFEFDLSELYARKLRKKIFESKGTFSNADFFKPLYDDVQEEYIYRHAKASQEADMGRNKLKLYDLHQEVLREIGELADFCKTCKPNKRKK